MFCDSKTKQIFAVVVSLRRLCKFFIGLVLILPSDLGGRTLIARNNFLCDAADSISSSCSIAITSSFWQTIGLRFSLWSFYHDPKWDKWLSVQFIANDQNGLTLCPQNTDDLHPLLHSGIFSIYPAPSSLIVSRTFYFALYWLMFSFGSIPLKSICCPFFWAKSHLLTLPIPLCLLMVQEFLIYTAFVIGSCRSIVAMLQFEDTTSQRCEY